MAVKREQVRARLARKVLRGDIGTRNVRRGKGMLAHVYRATFGRYGEKRPMVTAVKSVMREFKQRTLEIRKKVDVKEKKTKQLKSPKSAGKKKK